ncbi:MAG: hypothetical protein FJW81_09330 [Actinobacteria bacterium]|nr:hypothetical protein [Actinomycetota bacterium]
MSPFAARHARPAGPGPMRQWAEPIVVGAVAIGLIAGVMLFLGTAGVFGPLLVLVVAAVLGWRHGFVKGTVGAGLPITLLIAAELVRQQLSGDKASGVIQSVLIGASVILFMGGIAFLASALRGRYRQPAGERPRAEADYTGDSPWRS